MNFLKITLGVEKCTYLKCGASYPVKKKKRKKTGQIVTQGEKNNYKRNINRAKYKGDGNIYGNSILNSTNTCTPRY